MNVADFFVLFFFCTETKSGCEVRKDQGTSSVMKKPGCCMLVSVFLPKKKWSTLSSPSLLEASLVRDSSSPSS